MTLLLATFGVGLLSALFPLVNAEAYVGALAAVGAGSGMWAVAVAAALGQTCGKLVYFALGRSSLNWTWVARKTESARWQARTATWQRRAQNSPWSVTALIGASALLGIPPLAIISVLAGQLRTSVVLFTVAVLIGRTLRFAAVFAGLSAVNLP